MNLAANLLGPMSPYIASSLFVRCAAARYRLAVYLTCSVLALTISYALGKEMAWDLLNYHLYAGFSGIHDRFAQDYFAAGPQAYFNPYVYVPFYALVASGLPAIVVGSILAGVHSVVLWLTYELALTVSPAGSAGRRAAFAACAVAMAALNPILLQQLGTSFVDITTGELVLGGWLLLAMAVRAPGASRIIAAAVLLGVATALKLTNAMHAVSAAAMLLFLPLPFRGRVRFAMAYVAALGLSFGLVASPWAYRLYETFGNPFFPLLNTIFHSPEFTNEPLHHLRFVPSSLPEALWRPFAMLDPWVMVHEELRAPDSRYALLLVLAGMLLLLRLRKPPREGAAAPVAGLASDRRVLAALGCGFALDWVAWLAGSGNSRYFLPLACVAGVLVIRLTFDIFSRWPKVRNYVLAVILGTQALQVWFGSELRWNAAPWQGQWFDITVPEELAKQPALYLMAQVRSSSFLAPYLPRESGWIDIASSYPLEGTGASGRRVEALVQRYAPHVRLLVTGERLYADAERRAPSVSGMNSTLQRFALRVNPDDCATIAVTSIAADFQFRSASAQSTTTPLTPFYLVSCGLVPDHTDHTAEMPRQRTANLVLDRLEDACPELFQPRRPPTGRYAEMWRRIYLNTDLVAWVSRGELKFFDPVRGDDTVYLGAESDWAQAPRHLACGRRDGHYFATVVSPQRAGKEKEVRTAARALP
jgi:hypothetical protein